MNTIDLNITRDEILNLAAQKLVDTYECDCGIDERLDTEIKSRVERQFAKDIKAKIDAVLTEEMTRLMGTEIVPVNIWGEREGEPTTIHAQLAQRAKDFWGVNVNDQGKPGEWGGTPRYEVLMNKLLADEFAKAVKNNAEVIVAEFKKAMIDSSTQMVKEHINKLIK